jgi:hypothetical protein
MSLLSGEYPAIELVIVNWTKAPALLSLPWRAQLNCQPSADWIAPVVFFIIPRRGPHRKHRSYIVACLFVSEGTSLPSRSSETAICLFPYCLETGLYATTLRKYGARVWIAYNWLRNKFRVGSYEHGTEPDIHTMNFLANCALLRYSWRTLIHGVMAWLRVSVTYSTPTGAYISYA